MTWNLYFSAHHFGEFSTPPDQGTPDEKRLSSKLFRLPENRLQTLLLGLAGPWAQKRIPIFGGRVLPRGCSIDGGFRPLKGIEKLLGTHDMIEGIGMEGDLHLESNRKL